VERPRLRLSAATISTPDPRQLGAFYERLLGWSVVDDEPDWVRLRPPDGGPGVSFHIEPDYVRPAWPATPGRQQTMVHLDVAAEDLDAAVAWALELGATLAEHQPQDDVRVLLDPDGHPFCLFRGGG
jgi:catechol 2,3-dioxygenase-like lactoylglutathione lyase family enzyme